MLCDFRTCRCPDGWRTPRQRRCSWSAAAQRAGSSRAGPVRQPLPAPRRAEPGALSDGEREEVFAAFALEPEHRVNVAAAVATTPARSRIRMVALTGAAGDARPDCRGRDSAGRGPVAARTARRRATRCSGAGHAGDSAGDTLYRPHARGTVGYRAVNVAASARSARLPGWPGCRSDAGAESAGDADESATQVLHRDGWRDAEVTLHNRPGEPVTCSAGTASGSWLRQVPADFRLVSGRRHRRPERLPGRGREAAGLS